MIKLDADALKANLSLYNLALKRYVKLLEEAAKKDPACQEGSPKLFLLANETSVDDEDDDDDDEFAYDIDVDDYQDD